jgi:hypothetical protein
MSEGRKKGGRPRKYHDPENAKAAVKASKLASWHRRQHRQQPASSELQVQLDPLSTSSTLTQAVPRGSREQRRIPAHNHVTWEREEEEEEEEEEEMMVVEELDASDNPEEAIPPQEVIILLSFLTSVPNST